MKYITSKLKDKLMGGIGLSYVLEGVNGHNKIKKEDGSFENQDTKLIIGEAMAQNDLITIDFQSCEDGQITVDSDTLRCFGKEMIEWADIVEEII